MPKKGELTARRYPLGEALERAVRTEAERRLCEKPYSKMLLLVASKVAHRASEVVAEADAARLMEALGSNLRGVQRILEAAEGVMAYGPFIEALVELRDDADALMRRLERLSSRLRTRNAGSGAKDEEANRRLVPREATTREFLRDRVVEAYRDLTGAYPSTRRASEVACLSLLCGAPVRSIKANAELTVSQVIIQESRAMRLAILRNRKPRSRPWARTELDE